jgi:C-terminal processing protease CtpA/Prc
MRRFAAVALLLTVSIATTHTQDALTRDQRVDDLTQLASFYAKNYAPYEWKIQTQDFDLLRLNPWLQRIRHADDLQFHERLIEYVASLNDAHDLIAFPTTFSVSLPLQVDIYDGKVLIEAQPNPAVFPGAQLGDELVSIDGRSVQSLIASFRKYAVAANRRSTDRVAASRLVFRSQQIMPHISNLGDTAKVAIRFAATGAITTYVVPWTKNGIPVTSQGPVPSPRGGNGRLMLESAEQALAAGPAGAGPGNLFQFADIGTTDNTLPSYMDPIRALLNASVSKDYFSVTGIGGRFPIYNLPAGFVQRPVPTGVPAFLFSGTYMSNGVRIGLLRIPSMSPPSASLVLQHLDQEIAFFNANTDVLVIDVMRNPGGLVSFVEAISQRFMPAPFQTIGFEIRATAAWLFSFAAQLTSARNNPNTSPEVLANLEANFNEVLRAYNEDRGRSAPVSLNATGSLTLQPAPVTYNKPLMVLTDEFSASGGDMFPAIIQSNNRGPLFGMRTMGAGGSVVGFNGTAFTESFFRITVSLMNRGHLVQTPDFPPAPYIENIGVRPDILKDYMTRENLLNAGAPFVQAFTEAAVKLAQPTTTQ